MFVRVQERGRAAAQPGADGRARRAGVPGLPGGHPGPPGAVTDLYKAVKCFIFYQVVGYL